MNKYVQNFVWCLNSKILSYEIPENIDLLILSRIPDSFFKPGYLKFEFVKTDIEHYTNKMANIQISLEPVAIDAVQKKILNRTNYFNLTSLTFQILDLGFLNIISICDFNGDFAYEKYDQEGMKFSTIIAELQPAFNDILHVLEFAKVIKISAYYHFGVPSMLQEKKLHSADKSYLFNQHIFLNKEENKTASVFQNLKSEGIHFNYKGLQVTNIWGHCFWNGNDELSDQEIVDTVAIDSLCLAESVTYDNAISCYNTLIEMASENEKLNSYSLRKIFIFNNLMIQKIKLWKRKLTLEQYKFIENYYNQTNLNDKYNLFKNSEETLRFAIEGIEAAETQKSNRIIQFIISIFTALTIYSVVYDIYSFVGDKEGNVLDINIFSPNSYFLLFVTLVVILILMIFRNYTKKL